MRRITFLTVVVTLAALALAGAVYAQTGYEDPGPPPPFDWSQAQVADGMGATGYNPQKGQYVDVPVYCDSNWCVVSTETNPLDDTATDPTTVTHCWNTAGSWCIISTTDNNEWLSQYATHRILALNDYFCASRDQCDINFDAIATGNPPDTSAAATHTPAPTAVSTPVVIPSCRASYIETWPIQITGASPEGGKIAPPYPLVVGQDPERYGVTLGINVVVPPVVLHRFTLIEHRELRCIRDESRNGSGCSGPASRYVDGDWNSSRVGNRSWKEDSATWYECVENIEVFPDYVSSVRVNVNLTQHSREWILTDLAAAYPGASLLQPDFLFWRSGSGALQVNSSVAWSDTIEHIQTRDPGYYTTSVRVTTTGTRVSQPRAQYLEIGEFLVELIRITLIERQP